MAIQVDLTTDHEQEKLCDCSNDWRVAFVGGLWSFLGSVVFWSAVVMLVLHCDGNGPLNRP